MILISLQIPLTGNGGEIQWCFSQVKGTIEDEVTEGTSNVVWTGKRETNSSLPSSASWLMLPHKSSLKGRKNVYMCLTLK